MSLLPVDDAIATITAAAQCELGVESVPLHESRGRVLARDYRATADVPAFDNSAMDGYAVRLADAGETLPVGLRVAAGDPPASQPQGGIARIFTGAGVPIGAEAVVMQEDVEKCDAAVRLPPQISDGQNIRRRGQDCETGSLLLSQGRMIQPQDIGLLASQGEHRLEVRKRLKVAVLSTGSELIEPGQLTELPPGTIFNSNRPMLLAMVEALGCDAVDLGIVADNLQATGEALRRGAEEADVIITSGGVSVGEADFVREAVTQLGKIDLWRVAIKPGKPFAFGSIQGKPYLGLPGNPTSSFVTFALLARPFLAVLQGRSGLPDLTLQATAGFERNTPGSRTEFLRVTLETVDGEVRAVPFPNQSSGVLSSVSHSDALAKVPAGECIATGDALEILLLDSLG